VLHCDACDPARAAYRLAIYCNLLQARVFNPLFYILASLLITPFALADHSPHTSRAPSGRDSVKCVMAFAIHIQRATLGEARGFFSFLPPSGSATRPTAYREPALLARRAARSNRSNGPKSPKRGRGRLCDAARSSAYFYAFVINPHTLTHTHRGHNARVHEPPGRAPAKTAWSVHTTSARGGPCLPARCGDAHRRLDRLGQAGVLLL